MTMENRELSNKILKNVRNKIVVSNLEREENMKISKRKQAISVFTAIIIVLSGGLLTVNAATDGKLVEDIKQKCEEMIVVKLDNDNYKVTSQKDENGEEYITYTVQVDENEEHQYEIDKNALEKENMQTIIEEGEDGYMEVTFYDYLSSKK